MNIFVLDRDPYIAAQMHCDKHVIKMICEYAQLLSTAHRQLDGTPVLLEWEDATTRNDEPWSSTKKRKTLLVLDGETPYVDYESTSEGDDDNNTFVTTKGSASLFGRLCYNNTHHNHPCAIWARESDANYHWLVQIFDGVLREYEKRYQKKHATEKLREFFLTAPRNIKKGVLTPFAMAMPDHYKVDDEVLSYQNFYVGDKSRFAKWTQPATVPKWFSRRVQEDESYFQRPSRVGL